MQDESGQALRGHLSGQRFSEALDQAMRNRLPTDQYIAVSMLASVLAVACVGVHPAREAPAPISVPAGLSGELHYARFAASATLVPTGKVQQPYC
jgi:hypothetical protein